MDINTNKYRNYQKTEKAIKKALIALYNEKRNINKITVKELCERANISRSTFYLHYNDLISIFESVGDHFIAEIKEMIVELAKIQRFDFLPYFKKIFQMINQSNDLIKIGLSSEYPLVYLENVKNELEMVIQASPILNKTKYGAKQTITEIRIVVAGMIDLIINLIKKERVIDVDLYSEILNDFLLRWTSTLM